MNTAETQAQGQLKLRHAQLQRRHHTLKVAVSYELSTIDVAHTLYIAS